jgi:hypothetical protein
VENSVGKNRAEESLAKLQELNPYSTVKVVCGTLTSAVIAFYKVWASLGSFCYSVLISEYRQSCIVARSSVLKLSA